jgi:hypothetical protein
VPVQENMAKLKPEDRAAIAAYLKALPPLPDAVPKVAKKKKSDQDEDQDDSGGEDDAGGAHKPSGSE